MGCTQSTAKDDEVPDASTYYGGELPKPTKVYSKPKWKTDEPMTTAQLKAKREEFWDTQPHYGGNKIIWDALKAACEADMTTARLILESAGVLVASPDMTVAYDERGAKYELPKYVLSDPSNLIHEEAPEHQQV